MKLVKISKLFNVEYGNGLALNKQNKSSDGINFVSRTAKTNGVSAKIEKLKDVEPFEAGLITVSLGGSVLETFVQPSPFYTSYHIYCLTPKVELTLNEKLYYCGCIRANKYRYNYGRQANKTLTDITIPSLDEIPLWVLKAEHSEISDAAASNETSDLELTQWRWFRYSKVNPIV